MQRRRLVQPLLVGALLAGGFGVAAVVVPGEASAQVGFTANAGTLGVGADVAVSLSPMFGVRGRASFQPWEPTYTVDEVEVTAQMQSPNFSAFLDFTPFGTSIRLVGGVVRFGSNIEVVGVPLEPVDVNGVTYEPSQIGTLTGVILTKEVAPYAGIGFGNPMGRFGLVVDLGVAFQGRPELQVSADGPFANDPQFESNLNVEVQQAEEDLESFRFFPVISLGLSIGM